MLNPTLLKISFVLVIVFVHFKANAQKYFKQYIDSEVNCDEFNNQVLLHNDSIFLINFISCDTSPYYSTVLQYNFAGVEQKRKTLSNLVSNVNSGHLNDQELFIAGVNNNEISDSRLVLWPGNTNLDSTTTFQMDLFDPPADVYVNTMGSAKIDSGKVVYGQYLFNGNAKVYSFLLWLDNQLARDTLMIFDNVYDWSVISDAKIDSANNLIVLIDAAIVVDHITFFYRIIQKYNAEKVKVFEKVSGPVGDFEDIGSFSLIDSFTIVMEFVSKDNNHIHSLIALDKNGELLWEHIFHEDDPKSLYRITSITTTKEGDIICSGTYRNISQDIIETGYVCKFDKNGLLLWERIFYDQEEIALPESGFHKVIIFQSIAEASDHSIVIGGRVIHNFLSPISPSEIFLAVLNPEGCIYENCSSFLDITRVKDFLSHEKTWTEAYSYIDGAGSFRYRVDSIPVDLGTNTYYELQRAYGEFSEDWYLTDTWLREENGRIYEFRSTNDQIVYDFNLVEGDTFHLGHDDNLHDFVVIQLDSVSLLNGDLKKRWTLEPINPNDPVENTVWIEGIGNVNGLLSNNRPWVDDWDRIGILCVHWKNSIVFDNPDYNTCWIMTTSTNHISKSEVTIVPNPASEEITIAGLESEIELVHIFDSYGTMVIESKSNRIRLSELPVGYYFMTVQMKNSGFGSAGFVKM